MFLSEKGLSPEKSYKSVIKKISVAASKNLENIQKSVCSGDYVTARLQSTAYYWTKDSTIDILLEVLRKERMF